MIGSLLVRRARALWGGAGDPGGRSAPSRGGLRASIRTIGIAGALLASLFGFGTGCSKESDRLRLGEYLSLTGESASFGGSVHNGISLAVDEVNDGGGVDGIPLKLITRDAQSRPDVAAEAARSLAREDRVMAILGAAVSENSIAGASVCEEEKVPMVTPSSTHPAVTEAGPYIFRVCYTDRFQGRAMARFAYQSLGLSRVAVLETRENDYSSRLAEEFADEFTALGGEIAARQSFPRDSEDLDAVVGAVLGERPEAIFAPVYFDVAARLARNAREAGFRGPFLGGDGWDNPGLREIAGDALDGSYFTDHYSLDDPNPLVQAFARNYRAAYGEDPDAMAALGYDAARLIVRALREMAREDRSVLEALGSSGGNPERLAEIRNSLRDRLAHTAGFPGVTGTITLDGNRDAQKPVVVLQVGEDGFRFVERIAA